MFYGQEPMKRGLKRMNRGLERMVRFENPVFGGAERMIWRREPVICGLGRIPGRLEHWRRRQKHEKRALKHKAGRLEHWERWLGHENKACEMTVGTVRIVCCAVRAVFVATPKRMLDWSSCRYALATDERV